MIELFVLIYFLINLLDNLKTTDLMARIGYEIDF